MTTHGGAVTTTIQRQPYQGYPYVNPVVNDVPSIEPSTSYRTNLPRRPAAATRNPQKEVRKDELPPVIYVDIPETSTSEDGNQRNEAPTDDDDPPPVIYIDLPQSSNQLTESRTNEGTSRTNEGTSRTNEGSSRTNKGTSRTNEGSSRTNEGTSSSIDDTIYFDQFEDRRITPKDTASNSSDDSPSTARVAEPRPGNLTISKETYVYGRLPTPDDGFSLTPIPISEFPEPPPAYSEFQQRGPVTQQPTVSSVDSAVQNPPRTVIITNDLARSPTSQRKLLTCQHCGTRVHTMVLKQVGAATHALALSFLLFCLFPITILVYCCNWFKYENHYCPNCSKLIGYEVPMLCQTLVYVTTDLTNRVTS